MRGGEEMSQAVLINIRPKWCSKIANGEKTIEVRKRRPQLDGTFKVYIYCTKDSKEQFWTGPRYSYVDDHSHNMFDKCGNGKVIGDFNCYRVTNLFANSRFWLSEEDILHTCLSANELRKYANGAHELYGWHISDFKLYDKPLPLNTFKKWFRECAYSDLGFAIPDCEKCTDSGCFVQKPPQSWCFVEELQ